MTPAQVDAAQRLSSKWYEYIQNKQPFPQDSQLAAPSKATVIQVQQLLASLGYKPGISDGIPGSRSRAAVSSFQKRNNLPLTGTISYELIDLLKAKTQTASIDTI